MHKKAKALIVQSVLNELFPEPSIPLEHKDPFTLLVAVLLSAQCTDERVNKVTPALFAKADTPQAMGALSPEEIEPFIRSCGLYKNKSRALAGLSQMLVEQFGGIVPDNFAALESLPGVGHKTASVVMSQAFKQPAFPVDTHIHRCAQRWGLSKGPSVTETERDLKNLFPEKDWNRLHLQIIYFARKYCPARGHQKEHCPICRILL
jgi:endonuclease III